MSQTTVSEALAALLAPHVSHCFGLMGNGNAHFIHHLGRLGIPFTAVRHEAATVASADAFARVSQTLAVATTTYGAGFTNTLTALAEAAMARTPLLLVVGDAPTTGARPWDVDQEQLSAAIGVRTHTLSATNIAETLSVAVRQALTLRQPVVIALPYDLPNMVIATEDSRQSDLLSAAHPASVEGTGVNLPTPSPATLEAAARALASATRPAILAGRGAFLSSDEIGRELGALADSLGALTATTTLARGIFPRAEFDLGVAGGFGQERAMGVLSEADVVLVVGAGLNQFTMRFGELLGPATTIVRVDIDEVSPPKTAQPGDHLLLRGDATDITRLLAEEVVRRGGAPSGWRESVVGLEPGGALRVRDTGIRDHPDGICDDGRLDPRAVAHRIGELLPEDVFITSDGGHFLGWANMFWNVASPERLTMVGTAYQSIGLGLGTVPGVAAAATPGATVVLSTGDGGGLMALSDLESAIRSTQSGIFVVWNDAAYGAEVHLYGLMGLDQAPMLIPEVNFAGVATALGATGVRVTKLSDLDALHDWRANGASGTILLDCRISQSIVAPYQREIQQQNGL